MVSPDGVAEQQTVAATITSADSGTDWLPLREGGRYFDIIIEGNWTGRVALEVRPLGGRSAAAASVLEVFAKNANELFCLDQDADVRLWVRKGDLADGKMKVEIGT